MEVPFVDLYANYSRIADQIDEEIAEVIEQTAFIGGDQLSTFEEKFADYVDREYAVGVASGTDAIRLALEAEGVGEGDEVITVSHTWVSTVDGIVHNGARPRFVDINSETYTMDADAVEEAVTEDTAAILPVHLYGQPANLDAIRTVAKEYDLSLISDACQAHGSRYRNQRCGSFGDVACYSFYPSKNLGAFGDAGIAVTDDPETTATLRRLREYGGEQKHHYEEIGYNSRLDAIQAAVLAAKLPELDEWNEQRRTAAAEYDERLTNLPVRTPTTAPDAEHVYHLYVVETRSDTERDALQSHLDTNDIHTGIHYPVPVHKQPSYESLPYEFPELPTTERIAKRILSLPLYPEITSDEIECVCESIQTFYN